MRPVLSLAFVLACAHPAQTGDAPLDPAAGAEATPIWPLASMHHLYVAPNGSDGAAGTATAPFRTVSRASRAAAPSTTIHVAPGVYRENVVTEANGAPARRIRYLSDARWGAKIVGSGAGSAWTNYGSHVDIAGFDVSGSGRVGILNNASFTVIFGNHVHSLTLSGGCTGNGGAGINNANYEASDADIIGNVVHDIGVPGECRGVQGIYHSNLRGHILNNVVYRNAAYGIHLWHAANKVVVANNTVFANGAPGVGGGIVIGSGDRPGGIVLNHTIVINNIVFDNPGDSIREYCYPGQNCTGADNTIANNLVYRNGSGIALRTGAAIGTIAADPQFVNYQADGSGDYRLKPSSPAVHKGATTFAPPVDIDNAARPRGAAPDLGAYEHF